MADDRCFDGEMPMNRDVAGDEKGADWAPIDLVREAPFRLGGITVIPAELTVTAANWSRRLEPRVMQVLIMLARKAPEVVGRSELNARVWGGRVVGEDAINRTVQTLRRLASDAPFPEPFQIATIPRVGYRLTTTVDSYPQIPDVSGAGVAPAGRADPGASATVVSRSPRRIRPALAWAGLAIVVLASWAAWRALASSNVAQPSWAIASTTALDNLPSDASDAAISPDGGRLAYRARDAQGRERIFVRETAQGGGDVPVSPPQIDARRPAWSPDSRSLVFAGYDPARPCQLYVGGPGAAARPISNCETVRDPSLTWTSDGRGVMLGDAPGENGVQRISAITIRDGRRSVLTSPPADSMGDGLPIARKSDIVFQRRFGWADEGWIAHDLSTGKERLLWRRKGVSGSVAAALPDGTIIIASTHSGASRLDVAGERGTITTHPISFDQVTAISAAGTRLIVETSRSNSAIARAREEMLDKSSIETVRGRAMAPVVLPGGGIRFPVATANAASIWQSNAHTLRPWGVLKAKQIVGMTQSHDGKWTAALVTKDDGREIVLLNDAGASVYRWHPQARSLNAAAWSADDRHLIVPVLDGAGWRLYSLDPFGRTSPRDLKLPGYAVVQDCGTALYAVRAGESAGTRELWQIDGEPRRLPFDISLFDIVNWRATASGVWLPDRSSRDGPFLILRDRQSGRVVRRVAAPGLAGPGTGLAADQAGPIYIREMTTERDYGILTMYRSDRLGGT